MEVEIGRGKKARRAYGFDDIAIVPSRRTRDPDDVDISWTLGPYRFELPLLASAMDGVVSPQTAGDHRQARRPRRAQPRGHLHPLRGRRRAARADRRARREEATREMQEIYQRAGQAGADRPAHPGDQGAGRRRRRVADARSACERYYEIALDAGLDILVIQGTVVSAEHVSTPGPRRSTSRSSSRELPIPVVVGGCASYHTGLHLMRTGAAGVLVGVGPGAACTTRGVLGIGVPQATAIADVAAARSQHMLETGEYVQGHRRRRHAQRRRRREGDRLRRRRGDDRLAAGARLRGARPRLPLGHGDVPPDAAARRARARRCRTARSRRSSSAPRARTTARST